MEFRIGSQASQPLRKTRPLSAQPTAPLDAPSPSTPSGTRRLQTERPGTGSLEANPDFQALKAKGKLTPEVLAQLRTLATQPLAKGIDRRTLIVTALHELVNPERISQGDRETCAAAVVQAKLAQDDPAEYLRLLSGLASPSGEVTLTNGETLRRDPNWRIDVGRSLTGNLIQPAFMQFATGSYDNRTDTRATDRGQGKGLYAQEQTRLLNALSGATNTSVFGNSPQVLNAIQGALASGQTVPVILVGTQGGKTLAHSVLVERIQDGQVTFLDPSGRRRTVSLEAFTARLESASLPKSLVPTALLRASEGQKGSLAGWPDFWGAITSGAKALADGFTENVAKPVVQIVKGSVQAVHDHVVQPAAQAFATAGSALSDHVIQPLGQLAKPVVDYVFQPIYEYVLKPIYEGLLKPLAVDVLWPLWEKSLQLAKYLKEQIELNKGLLLNIGAIACAVTPGLNVLALIIAAGSAIEGGKRLYAGLRDGNWKEALAGAAELFTAAATAIGGPILSKAIGSGATAMARLATGLGKLADAGVALADVCNDKLDTTTRFGRLLSLLATGAGGGAAVIGEQAQAAAAGFTSIAEKANGYYDRSVETYRALMQGEGNWKATLTAGVGLMGDLQQDVRNDAASKRLNYQLKSATTYLNEGTKTWEGMTKGDPSFDPELLGGLYSLTGRVNRDVQNDWNPDVAPADERGKAESDRYAYVADLWSKSKGLSASKPIDQVMSTWWSYAKQLGESKGNEQLTQWLHSWTEDLERWGAEHGHEAQAWAEDQIQQAWSWLSEQRQAAKPS